MSITHEEAMRRLIEAGLDDEAAETIANELVPPVDPLRAFVADLFARQDGDTPEPQEAPTPPNVVPLEGNTPPPPVDPEAELRDLVRAMFRRDP